MKISSVNNYSSINNSKKQSFKGGTDFLVNFWQMIDNGGRAAQFTVEDMLGTNFPRSYKGLMAGYKYTKKFNILAFAQEAVREFLTGPTMCLMPVAILGISKKLTGETADTHIENIKNLSYLMGKTQFNSKETYEKDFFSTVIEDALKNSTGTDTINKEDVSSLADMMIKYGSLSKKDKKEKKALLDELETKFQEIVKDKKENFKDTNFAEAKYTIADGKTGATNFQNYVKYTINYAKDFGEKYLNKESIENITINNINQFKKSACGKRAVIIASMIGITGAAMSIIPKLYTMVSGSVNPNAKEIYKEAEKTGKGGNVNA